LTHHSLNLEAALASYYGLELMHASRALTALLLATMIGVGGGRTSSAVPLPGPADAAAGADGIDRTDALPGPDAFLAASPPAPVAAAAAAGRSPLSTARLLHLANIEPPAAVQAARITALQVARLAVAHELDAARIGYFSFGSTAPPPFHA
jgi:hypothetical protein